MLEPVLSSAETQDVSAAAKVGKAGKKAGSRGKTKLTKRGKSQDGGRTAEDGAAAEGTARAEGLPFDGGAFSPPVCAVGAGQLLEFGTILPVMAVTADAGRSYLLGLSMEPAIASVTDAAECESVKERTEGGLQPLGWIREEAASDGPSLLGPSASSRPREGALLCPWRPGPRVSAPSSNADASKTGPDVTSVQGIEAMDETLMASLHGLPAVRCLTALCDWFHAVGNIGQQSSQNERLQFLCLSLAQRIVILVDRDLSKDASSTESPPAASLDDLIIGEAGLCSLVAQVLRSETSTPVAIERALALAEGLLQRQDPTTEAAEGSDPGQAQETTLAAKAALRHGIAAEAQDLVTAAPTFAAHAKAAGNFLAVQQWELATSAAEALVKALPEALLLLQDPNVVRWHG